MEFTQRALQFSCHGSDLVGIIDVPARTLPRGVLVLAGGPQYRVGAHRQFTLLSRMLAQRGIPVMRFDRRGMGDSEGEPRSFDAIDDDIAAAIREFCKQVPELAEIVIWGLCDAATAAAFYAPTDPRVRGLVLLNPWIRNPHGVARAALRHYYLARLGEVGSWKKVASGNRDFGASVAAQHNKLRLASDERAASLPQRVMAGLAGFDGQVLVVLSGADQAAREFAGLMDKHRLNWRRALIADANHTFASRAWRDKVADISANWIMSW